MEGRSAPARRSQSAALLRTRRTAVFKALKPDAATAAPAKGPEGTPLRPLLCPAKSGTSSPPHPTGATPGLQLSGHSAQLSSHPMGDRERSGPAGHPLCTLQIPTGPRESNEATAASKSLGHICPSRLRAAGARGFRARVWGELGERRGRSTHGLRLNTHPDTAHAVLGTHPGGSAAPASARALAVRRGGTCAYLPLGSQSRCSRLPQPLSAVLGLMWTDSHGLCPGRALGRGESTYHLMVVAVGDVCFLEKSTESSL